jgi:hypothetical protein
MDLVVTGTLQNFTNIRYQLPHVGGAVPSILDRFLSIAPLIPQTSNVYEILAERVWWDSAGPTYPHQVLGLLGYGVGKWQLVYGTVSLVLYFGGGRNLMLTVNEGLSVFAIFV